MRRWGGGDDLRFFLVPLGIKTSALLQRGQLCAWGRLVHGEAVEEEHRGREAEGRKNGRRVMLPRRLQFRRECIRWL